MKIKRHNQIIHVSDTHIIIRLHTNETLNVPINELTFNPKVNDIVEVYQNQNHVVVCPLPQSNKLWILITLITLLLLTIIGATFLFFKHLNENIEAVDSQSSHQSFSTTPNSSASSSSSSSTSKASSNEGNIIDTTAEELRDMENDGRLKTGQLYRFTAELIRQSFWGEYNGNLQQLSSYYSVWVRASNAPITGIEIPIKKSLIEGWKEGMTATFTVKIAEDSDHFQYRFATDATLITTPTEEKYTENVTQEIDTQAILHGDYSSIAGTWRNKLGHEIVFNKNGLVKGGQINRGGISTDGVIGFDVRTGPTGYGMGIYPIGITIKWVDSDLSKNRITAGQVPPSSSEQVFYKTD